VKTVHELGWSTLTNGELLKKAQELFEVFVTTDRHLRFQQNLANVRMAIIVLPTTKWTSLQAHASRLAQAIGAAQAGLYVELTL
jgi:hypothetical protein